MKQLQSILLHQVYIIIPGASSALRYHDTDERSVRMGMAARDGMRWLRYGYGGWQKGCGEKTK